MTIWMCQDIDKPTDSGFGKTKRDAERYVSGNYGYDYYDHSGFSKCLTDGICRRAVKIVVPAAVAAILLERCKI